MKKAVYEVEMENKVHRFSESETGAFDFEGGVAAPEADQRAREVLAEDSLRVEMVSPDDNFGSPLYRAAEKALRPRVLRCALPSAGAASARIAGFLVRYPSFASYLAAGDFGGVGRLVERSRKLQPFRPPLQYIAGKKAFLPLALYWLAELDAAKESALAGLLQGSSAEGKKYGAVYDFAKEIFSARNMNDFESEYRKRLKVLLVEQHAPLVLQVVGTRFRSCIGEVAVRIASAQNEAFNRAMVDGKPEEEARERIRSYLESIQVFLTPEPYNRADSNAVSILLRFPNGSAEQAGYVKREIAAALAPVFAEGAALSGRLYQLCPGEADVQVRAE